MDNSSAILGVVLLVLFIGPILLLVFQQKNKDKNRLKKLKKLCSENSMDPDHVELSNTLLLGLDSRSKKLMIVEPKNAMQFDVIDLHEINRSKINRVTIPQPKSAKSKVATTRVTLDLVKNTSNQKVTEIIFYDEDDNTSLDADTQLFIANKWDNLIRTHLSA